MANFGLDQLAAQASKALLGANAIQEQQKNVEQQFNLSTLQQEAQTRAQLTRDASKQEAADRGKLKRLGINLKVRFNIEDMKEKGRNDRAKRRNLIAKINTKNGVNRQALSAVQTNIKVSQKRLESLNKERENLEEDLRSTDLFGQPKITAAKTKIVEAQLAKLNDTITEETVGLEEDMKKLIPFMHGATKLPKSETKAKTSVKVNDVQSALKKALGQN